MAAVRPLVGVQELDGALPKEQTAMPNVLSKTPIRPDVVRTVHTNMRKNSRQPYAVNENAGTQTAAASWGTGRAVSRIPRVPGGGTHRCGQGAYGNMCRGGHMFSPTKTWRRWHRKVNLKQKRYATASALAASAIPALVMARGHVVDEVPEIPLVVSDAVESITKTSKAIDVLKAVGAYADCVKAAKSHNIRKGKGKMRNRRYVNRKGPLVIYASDNGIAKSFRNLPGVDVCSVDRLNLLELAPGGHMGRLCVWTKGAFAKLETMYGEGGKFVLPENVMANSDLSRLINSDEVQAIVNPPKEPTKKPLLKRNPLKNLGAMIKLNPYAKTAKRMELLKSKTKGVAKKKGPKSKAFYEEMIKEHDYEGDDYDVFNNWLNTSA